MAENEEEENEGKHNNNNAIHSVMGQMGLFRFIPENQEQGSDYYNNETEEEEGGEHERMFPQLIPVQQQQGGGGGVRVIRSRTLSKLRHATSSRTNNSSNAPLESVKETTHSSGENAPIGEPSEDTTFVHRQKKPQSKKKSMAKLVNICIIASTLSILPCVALAIFFFSTTSISKTHSLMWSRRTASFRDNVDPTCCISWPQTSPIRMSVDVPGMLGKAITEQKMETDRSIKVTYVGGTLENFAREVATIPRNSGPVSVTFVGSAVNVDRLHELLSPSDFRAVASIVTIFRQHRNFPPKATSNSRASSAIYDHDIVSRTVQATPPNDLDRALDAMCNLIVDSLASARSAIKHSGRDWVTVEGVFDAGVLINSEICSRWMSNDPGTHPYSAMQWIHGYVSGEKGLDTVSALSHIPTVSDSSVDVVFLGEPINTMAFMNPIHEIMGKLADYMNRNDITTTSHGSGIISSIISSFQGSSSGGGGGGNTLPKHPNAKPKIYMPFIHPQETFTEQQSSNNTLLPSISEALCYAGMIMTSNSTIPINKEPSYKWAQEKCYLYRSPWKLLKWIGIIR